MRKRIFTPLFLAAFLGVLWAFNLPLLEYTLNQSTQALFSGSLRVGEVHWMRLLKIRLENVQGKFQSPSGPVPIEIRSIESQNSLFRLFSREGLRWGFEGARPVGSGRKGIRGISGVRVGPEGFLELQADVQGLDLEELVWINPENLRGSKGEIRGKMTLRQNAKGEVFFHAKLRVDEPGGRLQARFLNLLKPYLPQIAVTEKIKEIQATGEWMDFRLATLDAEMTEPDKMKIFLRLAVPDYNLNLHLKMEVRIND